MGKIEIDEQKYDILLEQVEVYFAGEMDQPIGELKAKLTLDFILESVGPVVYNKAVADMQKFLYERIDDLYEYER